MYYFHFLYALVDQCDLELVITTTTATAGIIIIIAITPQGGFSDLCLWYHCKDSPSLIGWLIPNFDYIHRQLYLRADEANRWCN